MVCRRSVRHPPRLRRRSGNCIQSVCRGTMRGSVYCRGRRVGLGRGGCLRQSSPVAGAASFRLCR
eukprot:5105236-Prorocentrum_lima.AAC.1